MKIINTAKLYKILIGLVAFLIIGGLLLSNYSNGKKDNDKVNYISYIPLGDSFTIGLGVDESHRWPNIMVENFAKKNTYIKILENPAVSGYTVRDMINYELPILKNHKPDFITVFIGTNDSFAQTDVRIFENDYKELLDKTQKLLQNPKNIVLITIPDYSKFPGLKNYQDNNLSKHISLYNEIIKKESVDRDLILADIYLISQKMTEEKYFISDGLHPTKTGYMKWERVIYYKVRELLFN